MFNKFFSLLTVVFLLGCFAQASASDASSSDQRSIARPKISGGRIAGGAVMAGLVGFGTGHAIVGKYREIGWAFTAADSVAVGLMVAGTVVFLRTISDEEKRREGCDQIFCGDYAAVAPLVYSGLGLLAVSRVWAVTDLLIRTSSHNDQTASLQPGQLSFNLVPTYLQGSGPGLALDLRF